jgi:hypothetical protein
LDRHKPRSAKANTNAELNATAWHTRSFARITREATKAEVSVANPLARTALRWARCVSNETDVWCRPRTRACTTPRTWARPELGGAMGVGGHGGKDMSNRCQGRVRRGNWAEELTALEAVLAGQMRGQEQRMASQLRQSHVEVRWARRRVMGEVEVAAGRREIEAAESAGSSKADGGTAAVCYAPF